MSNMYSNDNPYPGTAVNPNPQDLAKGNALQADLLAARGYNASSGSAAMDNGASAQTPGQTPNSPTTPAQQQDAMAVITDLLDQYGLGSLASWAWSMITSGAGANQVALQLRQQPAYQQRFPAIAAREKAGLPALSAGEYVAYENTATQLFNEAGIPQDFTTKADITQFLSNDVSPAELQTRIQQGYEAAIQAPAEVRSQLSALYGVDTGHLTAFFLDPTKALPIIQSQFRAAQIAGEGQITGYGQLTAAQAEGLGAQGVSEAQAKTGFTTLGREAQLFSTLPGEAGRAITADQQLGAEFGGVAADQALIEQRARARIAAFQGGGTFQQNARGVEGIGAYSQA